MASDPVPNIRFNVSKTLEKMAPRLEVGGRMAFFVVSMLRARLWLSFNVGVVGRGDVWASLFLCSLRLSHARRASFHGPPHLSAEECRTLHSHSHFHGLLSSGCAESESDLFVLCLSHPPTPLVRRTPR